MNTRFITKGRGAGRKVIPLGLDTDRQVPKINRRYTEMSEEEFIRSPHHEVGAMFKLRDSEGKLTVGYIYNKYVMTNIIIYYFRVTQPWYKYRSTKTYTHHKKHR